jgi:DNA-binding NarL/FixJ family response regulator
MDQDYRTFTTKDQPSNGNHKVSVMLVDDDPFFLRIAKIFLESYFGTEIDVVGTANCGEDCLSKVQILSPEVILMDLDMPGLGGLGTIPLVHILFPETRIIALSLKEDETHRGMVTAAGGDALVSKATMRNDLVPAIRQAVEKRELEFDFSTSEYLA